MGAQEIIRQFQLERHPEGGWFRRTWVKEDPAGGRGLASRIMYLLEADVTSRWHRIDGEEHYLWHAGATLEICTTRDEDAPIRKAILGPGDYSRLIVPEYIWQSARALGEWSLVSAIVLPEFQFEGFEMVDDGWQPV